MTSVTAENKTEATLPQDKVDVSLAQKKPDVSLAQKPPENKAPEAETEDPNWRAFREARKQDRAEKEAAQKMAAEKEAEANALKAAMEAAFANQKPANFTQVSGGGTDHYPEAETEDERIEKKVQAAITAREAQAEQQRILREQQEYPQRLVSTYNDFHQTISQENLDYLDFHYQDISRAMQRLPDGFDKWSDIYKVIKKLVPNSASAKKDAAKAEANQNKPRSMSSASITQPGEAVGSHRLTEDKRAENWARMQRILKGVG